MGFGGVKKIRSRKQEYDCMRQGFSNVFNNFPWTTPERGKVLLGVVYCEAVADCAFITDRSGLCPSLLYEGLVNLVYSVSSGVE